MKSRLLCKRFSNPFIVLVGLSIVSGCGKHPGAESVSSGAVYVSGAILQPSNTIATIWGNGTSSEITNNTPSSIYSIGNGVAIAGPAIYVAGYYETANDIEVAMLWQNGVGTALGPGGTISNASAVAVQGSDTYVAGVVLSNSLDYACCWKDGILTTLPDQYGYGSGATAIAVQGSNVYVAGWSDTQNSEVAAYWVNGTEYVLSDSTAKYSMATGIAVNGTDIYVLGWEQRSSYATATCWLNGVPQYLTDSPVNCRTTGIALNGSDVYVAGAGLVINGFLSYIDSSYLMYWKNNILQDPNDSLNKNANMLVGSIAVSGANVYIAGTINNCAALWKNGALTQLSNAKSIGQGVAIAP